MSTSTIRATALTGHSSRVTTCWHGPAANKVNYVIIFAEGCYNSKRQARRTVNLYQNYRNRVNFVVVDLDQHASPAQAPLVGKYYRGSIPTVVILNAKGAAIYDRAGEEDENSLGRIARQGVRVK